jgi:hypothetical protein
MKRGLWLFANTLGHISRSTMFSPAFDNFCACKPAKRA